MTFSPAAFDSWYAQNEARLVDDLMRYIAIDTASPFENRAFTFLHNLFQDLGAKTTEVPLANAVFDHPERTRPPLSHIGPHSRNFRARILPEGANHRETTLVSCHIDVVPGGATWPDAFSPARITDAVLGPCIQGRGACDTKGNLIMLVGALRFLQNSDIPLTRGVLYDGVIEEEVGGAGALSTAISLSSDGIDGVLVLEPTDLRLYRGHRGCLGVRITLHGEGKHMGASTGKGPMNAIGAVVDRLAALESELIAIARQDPAFAHAPRPVQVNVGRIDGGVWHGTAMQECHLLVNVGFPPALDLAGMEQKLRAALRDVSKDQGLRIDVVNDGLRNGAYVDPPDLPFHRALMAALSAAGQPADPPAAWHVSCDARSYARHMGLPTVTFGCGLLADAHSPHEKLALSSLRSGIHMLAHYFAS